MRVRSVPRRVVVVLVAVLAAGTVVGCDESDSDDQSVPPFVPAGIRCPAPTLQSPPSGPAPAPVPTGATEVRLCQSGLPFPVQEPRDSLVTDIEALTRVVNNQPERRADAFEGCSRRLPVSYVLAFGYADGTVHTVTGVPGHWSKPIGSFPLPPEPAGGWPAPSAEDCDRLMVGGGLRGNPDVALDEFTTLLEQQRSAAEPNPAWSRRPGCRQAARGATPVATIDDAVQATLCVSLSVSHPVPVSVEVTPDDLETLLTDRSPAPESRDCSSLVPRWTLLGTTAWGDTVSTSSDCGAWGDPNGQMWVSGPDAEKVLDRLVGAARTGR